MKVIIGYDPGGQKSNAIAIIKSDDNWKSIIAFTSIEESVDSALIWLKSKIDPEDEVIAAGLDTFLSWSTERSGWRDIDIYLKKYCNFTEGLLGTNDRIYNSIKSSNELYGSMMIQGMAMAIRLKQLYSNIILNETHPKIAYFREEAQKYNYIENRANMDSFLFNYGGNDFHLIKCNSNLLNLQSKNKKMLKEDEWDALYSCLFTLKYGLFKDIDTVIDLMNGKSDLIEVHNLILPVGDVHYYWL